MPAIVDCPEFIVARRQNYTVIDYVVAKNSTFPPVQSEADAIRRECRGLIFDINGNLISRPYSKFFNLGEREETLPVNVDLSRPHIVLDKCDGSMIRPILLDDKIFLATRMGVTDVAMQAHKFISENKPHYFRFFMDMIAIGRTAIFEWCSPLNRIVVPYAKSDLILTAIRDNENGQYVSYDEMVALCDQYDLSIVKAYRSETDIMTFMNRVKDETGIEGYVVRWDDGTMIKLKTDEYRLFHSSRELIQSERKTVSVILNNKMDDLKTALMADDLKIAEQCEKMVDTLINNLYKRAMDLFLESKRLYGDDRREFSLGMAKTLSPTMRSLLYGLWDCPSGEQLGPSIITLVEKRTHREQEWENFRNGPDFIFP